jgi:hypothetical protein
MRGALVTILILACAAGSADARRHRYRAPPDPYNAVTPAETGRPYAPRRAEPMTPGEAPDAGGQTPARLVPADWHEEPADPQFNGQRFISPDGSASFVAYTVPVGEEGIAAHMKAVAFVDGETVTYLRGERSWVAVSGFKQDRVFYRAAVLACAGDRWHHIMFEYPASAKGKMREFVERAATTVRNSDNRACDVPLIRNQ